MCIHGWCLSDGTEQMRGQWIGRYTGSAEGTIIVNIDEFPSNYGGVAYLNEDQKAYSSTAVFFSTVNKSADFAFRTSSIHPIDPTTGVIGQWEGAKGNDGSNVAPPGFADVRGSCRGDSLALSWDTDTSRTGSATLTRSGAAEPSELAPLAMGWEEYKAHVGGLEERRYLFRGQNRPWRLRTSFHRTGRADLVRFLNVDIQVLHRHLSARTRHFFDLQDAGQNGAFFNLIQHHGYPTPLLDWSYSPYVAVFFAYRGISNEEALSAKQNTKVRILVFDQAQWKADWPQLAVLTTPAPHLSFMEFVAVENERMIPQQAASTVTNIDDIEAYVRAKETQRGRMYLSAIDLPVTDRRQVVRELGYMGITAGSLFPGLDGACEELRERNFEL